MSGAPTGCRAEGWNMSVRVLHDQEQHVACLYDSVTGIAFGETFTDSDTYPAGDRAESFIVYCLDRMGHDPRKLSANGLDAARRSWARNTPLGAES